MSAEVSRLDIEAAERRVAKIRHHATAANEAAENVMKLVHQARDMEDHMTLGFASWTAYLADVFGDEPLRITRDARRELVAEMSAAGMSTRAIAPVVGVSQKTVDRDVRESFDSPESPSLVAQPNPVNVDGLTVDIVTGEVVEDAPTVTERTVTEKVKTVTGLDGKEYKRPEPKPREPKPVPSSDEANRLNAIQASKALGSALETIEGLTYGGYRLAMDPREAAEGAYVPVCSWWSVGGRDRASAPGDARQAANPRGGGVMSASYVADASKPDYAAMSLDKERQREEAPGPDLVQLRIHKAEVDVSGRVEVVQEDVGSSADVHAEQRPVRFATGGHVDLDRNVFGECLEKDHVQVGKRVVGHIQFDFVAVEESSHASESTSGVA